MINRNQLYACLLLSLLLACRNSLGQQINDGIYYSSLNYAIQLGQFDGVAQLRQMQQNGDFGVGSQQGLAGEMVLLDGKAYRISIDGHAVPMPADARLPFAAVKLFRPEKQWTLNQPLNLVQLQSYLDSLINTNMFTAIRITGSFSSLRYKCYYPQQKPYPPISETPAKFFDSTDIQGTMVGFFTPKSALLLNSPNYHFHFINSARTSGGHVDNCILQAVRIEVDYADALHVLLPPAASLKDIRLNEPMKQ